MIGSKAGRIALVGAAIAVCGGLALAQQARPTGYLTAEQLPDSVAILSAPPADGSEAAKADRAAFEASRSLAGSPRWAQAIEDVELFGPKAHRSFACAAGKAITPEATPVLSRMLGKLVIDAGGSTNKAKAKYSRTRPLIGHDDAPICVPREEWMKTNGSYPSGHAAAGWAWGLVLTELVPERATQITLRAREFGDSRWICGVHFPSDVEAGRIMAAATVARLHAEPGFVADLATAKAELAKAPPAEGCGV
ncbi:phosphatase PAP2 family protein [Caulobacter sp. SLTY]|uniref:acid phosphatase n=1 Tax=Caulobacter sp. SLTY TaxID=2683262 RepID=UPI0014133435|nr:phosphatase PAP2 family protein [Caulobacter sp. SLTY]NBB16733.1 phosphatase PAP2 family protein [Caulobacter sp. SLTY]NBB16767.1 phosphatase PAP2 family protein [Caulobacter sp. SLTY]